MSQEKKVRTRALMITPFQWNSSPARLVMMISTGTVRASPIGSSISPNTAIAATMMSSGRQANAPTGSPPSLSIVSDLKRTNEPRIARMIDRPSGK